MGSFVVFQALCLNNQSHDMGGGGGPMWWFCLYIPPCSPPTQVIWIRDTTRYPMSFIKISFGAVYCVYERHPDFGSDWVCQVIWNIASQLVVLLGCLANAEPRSAARGGFLKRWWNYPTTMISASSSIKKCLSLHRQPKHLKSTKAILILKTGLYIMTRAVLEWERLGGGRCWEERGGGRRGEVGERREVVTGVGGRGGSANYTWLI